jgi:hypothetical protein
MEQLVINHLLLLLLKSGHDQTVVEGLKGDKGVSKYKHWTDQEIETLLVYLNQSTQQFNKRTVISIIENLLVKYNIPGEELMKLSESLEVK